jgi:hypothetical protein
MGSVQRDDKPLTKLTAGKISRVAAVTDALRLDYAAGGSGEEPPSRPYVTLHPPPMSPWPLNHCLPLSCCCDSRSADWNNDIKLPLLATITGRNTSPRTTFRTVYAYEDIRQQHKEEKKKKKKKTKRRFWSSCHSARFV